MWREQSFVHWLVCVILLRAPGHIQPDPVQVVKLQSGEQWRCSFVDQCGIVNQSNMPANFTLLPTTELFGERGLFYLDSSKCHRNGARLITPYFAWSTHLRTVCLTLKYVIFGNAVTRFLVVKQDKVNVALWSDKLSITGRWNYAHIKVNVLPDKPARFFVEVNFNNHPNRVGFLAISEVILRDSYCPR